MSIPITFQNECYFIVDKATLSTVNVLFVGNVFIGGRLYKNTLVSTEIICSKPNSECNTLQGVTYGIKRNHEKS